MVTSESEKSLLALFREEFDAFPGKIRHKDYGSRNFRYYSDWNYKSDDLSIRSEGENSLEITGSSLGEYDIVFRGAGSKFSLIFEGGNHDFDYVTPFDDDPAYIDGDDSKFKGVVRKLYEVLSKNFGNFFGPVNRFRFFNPDDEQVKADKKALEEERIGFFSDYTYSYHTELRTSDPDVIKRIFKSLTNFASGETNNNSGSHETISNLIYKLFPSLEQEIQDRLYQSIKEVCDGFGKDPSDIIKVTDRTGSDAVIKFKVQEEGKYGLEDRIVYCKISADKAKLRKEHQYYEDAWSDKNKGLESLVKVITQKPEQLIECEDCSALISYGTENPGLVEQEDHESYLRLFDNLRLQLAIEKGCDPEKLSGDEYIQDVFNRALAHAIMKKYSDKPIYNDPENRRPLVIPFEELHDRAGITEYTKLFDELLSNSKAYEHVRRGFEEEDELRSNHKTLINGDARQENNFLNYFGMKIIGDYGDVRGGFPEDDLAKLESPNNAAYVPTYMFFRNKIEGLLGSQYELTKDDEEVIGKRVNLLSPLNVARAGSFKLMMNLREDSVYYIDLTGNYIELAAA